MYSIYKNIQEEADNVINLIDKLTIGKKTSDNEKIGENKMGRTTGDKKGENIVDKPGVEIECKRAKKIKHKKIIESYNSDNKIKKLGFTSETTFTPHRDLEEDEFPAEENSRNVSKVIPPEPLESSVLPDLKDEPNRDNRIEKKGRQDRGESDESEILQERYKLIEQGDNLMGEIYKMMKDVQRVRSQILEEKRPEIADPERLQLENISNINRRKIDGMEDKSIVLLGKLNIERKYNKNGDNSQKISDIYQENSLEEKKQFNSPPGRIFRDNFWNDYFDYYNETEDKKKQFIKKIKIKYQLKRVDWEWHNSSSGKNIFGLQDNTSPKWERRGMIMKPILDNREIEVFDIAAEGRKNIRSVLWERYIKYYAEKINYFLQSLINWRKN